MSALGSELMSVLLQSDYPLKGRECGWRRGVKSHCGEEGASGGERRCSQGGVKQSRVEDAGGGVRERPWAGNRRFKGGESSFLGGVVFRRQIAKHQPRAMRSMSIWRFWCQALVLS